MAWTPIERLAARPETREHRLDAALVTFAVLLNRSPPEDWVAVFLHPPGRSRVIHELAVTGSTVTVTAEKGDDVSSTLADSDGRNFSISIAWWPVTTTTRSTPAACAARTPSSINGTPPTGVSGFESEISRRRLP